MDMRDFDSDDLYLAKLVSSIKEVSPIFDLGAEVQKATREYMNNGQRGVEGHALPSASESTEGPLSVRTTLGCRNRLEPESSPVAAHLNNAAGEEMACTAISREAGPEARRANAGIDHLQGSETVGSIPIPAAPNKDAEIARRMAIVMEWAKVPVFEYESFILDGLILEYRARLEKWEPLSYEHDFEREQAEDVDRMFPKEER